MIVELAGRETVDKNAAAFPGAARISALQLFKSSTLAMRLNICAHLPILLLSHQSAKETEAVKRPWNKWTVREMAGAFMPRKLFTGKEYDGPLHNKKWRGYYLTRGNARIKKGLE